MNINNREVEEIIIESNIRDYLLESILENEELSDSEKLDQISKTQDLDLSESDYSKFINNVYTPLLESDNKEGDKKNSTISKTGIAAGIGTVALITVLSNMLVNAIDKCAKFEYGTRYLKCKSDAYNKVIALANQQKSKCSRTKNPEKCKMKLNHKIDKYKLKLKKINENIKNFKTDHKGM